MAETSGKTMQPGFLRWLTSGLAGLVLACGLLQAPALAQNSTTEEMPNQVRTLLDLLADPTVREWVEKHRAVTTPSPEQSTPDMASPGEVTVRLEAVRHNIAVLIDALPRVRAEIERASSVLFQEFEERGLIKIVLLVAGFTVLGLGVEWVFWRATATPRKSISALPLASVKERVIAILTRLVYGVGSIAAFAIGSIGAFLAFNWPPLLGQIVLGYLTVFLVIRLGFVVGRFLLAPGGRRFRNEERFRIVPMSNEAARYWHLRFVIFVGWIAFGWITIKLLLSLGFEFDALRLVAFIFTLSLLLICEEAAWRRPRTTAIVDDAGSVPARRHRPSRWLLSAYFVLLWVLWVVGVQPKPVFWLILMAGALPVGIGMSRRAVNHVLRPPGAADAASGVPSLVAVCLERGLLAALVIGAGFFLASKFEVDILDLTTQDTPLTRIVRGALSVVVIVLLADFAWHLFKAAIDRKLLGTDGSVLASVDDARRNQRLKTLLPIFRSLVLVVLLVVVALMVLSQLGIEIGPLIAGAGVVGVAIGFGAQTLVKDIISGMFYLLDDAFRIGEYIQSDKFKGTVESFSLRSIKLRHHRGPLYTVPFGELGAIENMSRDWVIDKLAIGVTYDSDIGKAKKLIKEIGLNLAKDPEFAANIIEPLKMQGVEKFGDFAVELRLKIKTKPGEQFVIRRRAYAMIKAAFEANGVKFAYPTVQVAGGGGTPAAVAHQALQLAKDSTTAS